MQFQTDIPRFAGARPALRRLPALALLVLLLALPFVPAIAQAPGGDKCTRLNNTGAFACSGEIISWIEIRIEGDLLKPQQADFEALVRRRLQEELPYLGHERQRFVDAARAMRDRPIGDIASYRAQRGEVGCFVWTVGTDYPIPVFVECKLTGWGIGLEMTNEFSARYLGAGPPQDIPGLVETGIRHTIGQIANQLLAQRQEWRRRTP